MPQQYRVTAAALNVRSVASTLKNTPIASMPKGTVFTRVSLSPDRAWQKIGVELESEGRSVEGWCSASPSYSEAVPQVTPAPTGLSSQRFNVAARRKYIDSILKEVNGAPGDRYAFLRPARAGWGTSGLYLHGYIDGTKYYQVGIDFKHFKKNGTMKVTRPTAEITAADYTTTYGTGKNQTYCNFNVSFCHIEAYGGGNLQDTNGLEKDGELSANGLVGWLESNWKQVPVGTAARIANAGGFVVAGKKEPEPKSGHVTFLVEGSDEGGDLYKVRCFNVGGSLPALTAIKGAWNSADASLVRFFTSPETLAEWNAAGGV